MKKVALGLLASSNSLIAAFAPSSIVPRHAGSSDLFAADTMFVDKTDVHSAVTDYYGKTLQQSSDLKTNACCTAVKPAPNIAKAIANIHPDGERCCGPQLTVVLN